jgi:hypothetical protein
MDTDGVILARYRSSDEMMDVVFRQMGIMSNRIDTAKQGACEYQTRFADLSNCRIGWDFIIQLFDQKYLPSGVESAETCSGPDKLAWFGGGYISTPNVGDGCQGVCVALRLKLMS